MDETRGDSTIDLIRWTFTADPDRRDEIERHLVDLGLDVSVRGDAQFCVLWEEPEGDPDVLIEALWALNGVPFEITQEEFHRRSLLQIQHEEDEGQAPPGRAVA